MKLQLDTTNKTISIEEAVTFGELLDTLEQILPNGKWADFKLIKTQQLTWNTYPMYVPNYLSHPTIDYPWLTTSKVGITPGVFNISTKE